MKMFLHFSGVLAALLLMCGCVSYEYQGEKLSEQSGSVAVFSDSGKVVSPYRVLGKATVSGDYQNITRDTMVDKLVCEAARCGADAVLIIEQQVVPAGTVSRPVFDTAFDYDDTNASWRQIDRDVDVLYGKVGAKDVNPVKTVKSFTRIIRAEFLKYTEAPVKSAE